MEAKEMAGQIIRWLTEYHQETGKNFVVGVSGGIDSAVTAKLCALASKETGASTFLYYLPYGAIRLDDIQSAQIMSYMNNLTQDPGRVRPFGTAIYTAFESIKQLMEIDFEDMSPMTRANSIARLRMVLLYAAASEHNALVVGTGNKIEDFGVGFFTKYGDGGVDISPIGDLYKSEVYAIGRYLEIPNFILDAPPTDGLWEDGRTDEDQLGISYDDLEWAMKESRYVRVTDSHVYKRDQEISDNYTDKQKEALRIYAELHNKNSHKMAMPPVCGIQRS